MTSRSPFTRGVTPELDLPDGKTCADCVHVRRCTQLFGHIPEDEVCDWVPIRFRERAPKSEAETTPIGDDADDRRSR